MYNCNFSFESRGSVHIRSPSLILCFSSNCVIKFFVVNISNLHNLYCTDCLSVYSCCSHLEHRASMKRFVSLQFFNLRQLVGPLGRMISLTQGYTGQHKHRINADKHPCLEWDSNPCFQRLSGQRHFMP
jgi:hypothetical protein